MVEERPVWEVRPDQNGWQLQHMHGGGHHPLTSQSGPKHTAFWPLHRVHAYDAFWPCLVLHDPIHFEVPQHQSQGPLESSPFSLLHRHRDVRDEHPAASNESPSAEFTDPEDETEANTVSDSSASQTDTGVHWDFGSRLSVGETLAGWPTVSRRGRRYVPMLAACKKIFCVPKG